MKSIDQIIANLPPQRRAKIEARTREVVGEELALQQLRKARRLTQKQMARFLGVGQDSISRLESRSDLLISTLQSYVEAMGGALKIVVEFKYHGSVWLRKRRTGQKVSQRSARPQVFAATQACQQFSHKGQLKADERHSRARRMRESPEDRQSYDLVPG